MKRACSIGLMLSLFAAGLVRAAAFDRWEKIGPRGGKVFCAAVHPTSLDTIYAALEEGVYRSVNGGENWSKLSQLPTPGHIIVFDPQNSSLIYTWAGYKLHKSYDGGNTWTQITSFYGRSFAVDPSHPSRLYIGSYNGIFTYEASVYISADGGVSWVESQIGGCCLVSALAVDPSDSNIVYAGMEGGWDFPGNGVYKSTDGGLTWENMSSGLPYSNVNCLEIDPSDPLTLYAGTSGSGEYGGDGIYKTTDGGVTWAEINKGLPGWGSVSAMRIDPHRPEILYAAVSGGLFKSIDGGANWFPLDTRMSHGSIYSIDIFPGASDIIFFSSGIGVLKSTSGGDEFTQMGIIPIDVSSVVVDHEESETIYAIGRGVFKSTDFGEHWQPISNGMGGGRVIVQDPECNRVLYAGVYAPWGAVYKTTDAGRTWQKTSLKDVAINDIRIAPTNPSIVFAGGSEDPFVGGIFKSEDAGCSWDTVSNFYTDCVAIDPKNVSIIYAAGHTGLKKSIDGGTTWFPVEDGLNLPESGYVDAIIIDPHHTSVLYCGTSDAGVFKSIDGGSIWKNASTGISDIPYVRKDIRALVIDPEDSNILYTGTFGGGVFVTVDGGKVWRQLGAGSGYSSSFGLALDPHDPNIIYSAGGGLWRYIRKASCIEPEIVSYSPPVVDSDNCVDGCVVNFNINTDDDCSEIAMIALERRLGEEWVLEDALLPPIPDPSWKLTCTFDEHFTDGEHKFRAVIRCEDGSKAASEAVIVTADRGVHVTISGFESIYSQERVALRWTMASTAGIQGFNIYRSFKQGSGFRRINEAIITADTEYEYIDEDAKAGQTYWYRLGAVGTDGEWFSQAISVSAPPLSLRLFQNCPNPFNRSTVIPLTLPYTTRARLSIYTVEGKLVRTLVDDMLDEGYREITWDGTDARGDHASSGVYLYRLRAGHRTLTKKMILLK